jgi:hypothetical protein
MRATEPVAWKVGLARAKITPAKPMWMAGYGGRNRPAEGTQHDLWLKALAIEAADGGRAVIVTSDLLGFPKGVADPIGVELRSRCSLECSQLMLTASHTHCGPVLRGSLYDVYPLDDTQRGLIEEYSRQLEKTAVATVAEALAHLAPATLWSGEGVATFAVNRRNNPEGKVLDLRRQGIPLKGPSDHRVPVLAIRKPMGNLQATVFGYACHNTTLSFYQWCGDYAGFAQLALERKHPDLAAMFYEGCGADQNPIPRRTLEQCQQYGQELADAVDAVLARPMRPIAPRLRTAFEILPLGFVHPTVEELQKMAKEKGYQRQWAERLLAEMKRGGVWPKTYPYPVQVWKLGADQLWVVLGGEVVVDYALFMQKKYPQAWVAGYSNDVMSYIPSHRIWEEGRYEAGAFTVYGLPAMKWNEDIEQRILACIDRLVERVK